MRTKKPFVAIIKYYEGTIFTIDYDSESSFKEDTDASHKNGCNPEWATLIDIATGNIVVQLGYPL